MSTAWRGGPPAVSDSPGLDCDVDVLTRNRPMKHGKVFSQIPDREREASRTMCRERLESPGGEDERSDSH